MLQDHPGDAVASLTRAWTQTGSSGAGTAGRWLTWEMRGPRLSRDAVLRPGEPRFRNPEPMDVLKLRRLEVPAQ